MSDNHADENARGSQGTLGMIGQIIGRLVTAAIVLAITAFFTPGFSINNFWSLALAAVVLTAIDYLIVKFTGLHASSFGKGFVGFALAATGAIKEDVFDREQAVELLLDFLINKYPEDLQTKYAVSLENSDDVNSVMTKIANSRGCLKAGGLLDLDKVFQLVLRDFRAGRLGRFTLDEP